MENMCSASSIILKITILHEKNRLNYLQSVPYLVLMLLWLLGSET